MEVTNKPMTQQPVEFNKVRKKLTNIEITSCSKNTSILFLLLPEWANIFPPYNIARLLALAKANGFKASAIDINIEAFNQSKKWSLDYDPWSTTRDFKWTEPYYYNELHKHIEPLLLHYLDVIGEMQPTIVAFTLYYCNVAPTNWLIAKIKERYPHIIIAVGGPQCADGSRKYPDTYDYISSGEGEKILLEILNEVESNGKPNKQRHLIQPEGERLNLDSLPIPDYSFADFKNYRLGVNTELSRGCIAKCTFCNETHFWKFRERTANAVFSELNDIHQKHSIQEVIFVDSLLNGDLRTLLEFAKKMKEANSPIKWLGFARCDGRMDLEYLTTLQQGGLIGFMLGCESGSNNVLAAMNKKITREEIEQNLHDSKVLGLQNVTMWIVGFPTETLQDFYETLLVIYRVRNTGITVLGVNPNHVNIDSITAEHPDRFNLLDAQYLGQAINKDFTNSKVHRLVRIKSFAILVHFLYTSLGINIEKQRQSIGTSYTISYKDAIKEPVIEQFDFDIIKTGKGPFADSLVNEIWPLLRVLWKVLGEYSIVVIFDSEIDKQEFPGLVPENFTAEIRFGITSAGEWTAAFYYKFKQQEEYPWRPPHWRQKSSSVANERVKRLVNNNATFDEVEYNIQQTVERVKDLDFSFEFTYYDTDKWE